MTTAERYRKLRADWPYYPARYALIAARDNAAPEFEWTDNGESATTTRDGFDIVITVDVDDIGPDGTFTDTFTPGLSVKIVRSEFDVNAYRVYYDGVSGSLAEHRKAYSEMGYAKHTADCQARANLLNEMRDAMNGTQYVLIVKAMRNGIELASDALGGIGLSAGTYGEDARREFESVVHDHDMIGNATSEARLAVAALCQPVKS